MNSERNIVKKLFENRYEELEEKTYTVGDTQYWRRNGQTYKWTSSAGRSECSEDEYNKAVDACRNGGQVAPSDAKDQGTPQQAEPDKPEDAKGTEEKPERMTQSRKEQLAYDKNTDPEILRQLATLTPPPKNGFRSQKERDDFSRASARQTSLRSIVASNPSTPPDVLEKFMNSDRIEVWGRALSNPSMPEDVLRRYAEKGTEEAQDSIARNKKIPPDVAKMLAQSKHDKVKKTLYDNPNVPDDIKKDLSGTMEDNSEFRLSRLKGALYRGESIDDETLATYAEDKDEEVREYVAEYDSTPPEVLLRLSNDKNPDVVRSVLKNPKSPDSAIDNIIAGLGDFDYDDSDRGKAKLVWSVANSDRTPEEVLQKLATHNYWEVRSQVAENKNCPEKLLRKLARDKNSSVQTSVAENPNTPPDVLQSLADRADSSRVEIAILENPNTPVKILQQEATSDWEYRREAIARNTSAPEELLKVLTKDPDIDVRRAAKETLRNRRG